MQGRSCTEAEFRVHRRFRKHPACCSLFLFKPTVTPMPTPRPTVMLAVLLMVGGLAAPSSSAFADSDHEQARRAVQAGEILPLPQILERVARRYPGQVLEVELERKGDRWVYELKVLQSDGRLIKMDIDARSGEFREKRGGERYRDKGS